MWESFCDDSRSDDVGKQDTTKDATQPNGPVLDRVVGQVVRVLEGSQHDPLGWDVGVEGSGDEKGRETETVGDSLDQGTGTSQGRRGCPFTTVVVDDDTDNL